jgi:hypothetical protein
VGTRFSAPVQTGPGAHPTSYTRGTGSFSGVKCSEVPPPLGLLTCSRVNFMVPLQMEIQFDINIYFGCLLSHKVFISVIPVFGIISGVMKEEKLANTGVIFATWRYKDTCFCCAEQFHICELRIYDIVAFL